MGVKAKEMAGEAVWSLADDAIVAAKEKMLAEGLRTMVRGLVADINRERGDDYLYFAEFAGVWLLLAKQKDKCDRRVDFGFSSAADLSRVAGTLQKALEKEIVI